MFLDTSRLRGESFVYPIGDHGDFGCERAPVRSHNILPRRIAHGDERNALENGMAHEQPVRQTLLQGGCIRKAVKCKIVDGGDKRNRAEEWHIEVRRKEDAYSRMLE